MKGALLADCGLGRDLRPPDCGRLGAPPPGPDLRVSHPGCAGGDAHGRWPL